MNKSTIAIIAIVLIVGWFLLMRSPKTALAPSVDSIASTTMPVTSASTTVAPAVKPTAAKPAPAKNTFPKLFAQNGSHKCTFEQVTSSSRSNNIIYLADGKMRGEFRSSTGDKQVSTLMIYDAGYLYSWVEGTTAGTKSRISSIADLPTAIPQDLSSGAIFGAGSSSVSWDCHPWIKEAALMKVPAYVKF